MDGEAVTLTLKGNKWLKHQENASSILSEEGIIVDKVLGEGAYAKVMSAYCERLKSKVAVKITDKRKAPKDYLERFLHREVNAIYDLDHPNIVKLLGIFESRDRIFMVMEFCSGGDLLDYVNEQKYEEEGEIKRHFQQFACAIYHTHQRGIVHRDLKLENLVLDSEGNLKVTDFGFARHSQDGNLLQTCCGSYAYACPAILRGESYNGFAADVWSMGIVLYTMFTYKLPYGEAELEMFSNSCKAKKLKFTQDTPQDARDLIRKMLEPDPTIRITCAEIINHVWLRDKNFPPDENLIMNGDALRRSNNRSNMNSNMNSNKNGNKTMSAVSSETSSIEADLSFNGPIQRNQDNLALVADEERDPAQESGELIAFTVPQFQLIAVRRSIQTSGDDQRVLANVVQPKPTNLSQTIKKKKVALMCLGGFGKRKKEKLMNGSAEEDGRIKYKEEEEKKGNLCDLVTQITRAKAARKKEKNFKDERGEFDGEFAGEDSDEECIKLMRRELESLKNEDSSLAIEKSEKNFSQSDGGNKVGKWQKICGKLAKKGS